MVLVVYFVFGLGVWLRVFECLGVVWFFFVFFCIVGDLLRVSIMVSVILFLMFVDLVLWGLFVMIIICWFVGVLGLIVMGFFCRCWWVVFGGCFVCFVLVLCL